MSEPIHDKREALARAIGDSEVDGRSAWGPDFADPSWEFMRDRDRAIADVVLGFRRSEVPEPSAEGDEFSQDECDGSGTCPARRHIHGCYTRHRADECDSPEEYGHLPAEPQGEPSDAPMGTKADLEARAHLFGKPERVGHAVPEPQGEPSDAQIDRGAQALFEEMLRESSIGDVGGTFERCRKSARIVLRAAGGAR